MRNCSLGRIAGICWWMLASCLAPYAAASAETLVLTDGAVIHGEIESLLDDVYTVKTESLGTLRVRKEDVRSIDHRGGSTPGSSQGSASGVSSVQAELQSMQSRLMQVPNLFAMIQALQSDPAVQAVLADPDIMSAMAAGDYATLINHPKIIALTENANVREVVEAAQ